MGLGHTPVSQMEMLNRSTKKPSVARSLVYKWHKGYSEGSETIIDVDRCGLPVSKSKTSGVKSCRMILALFPKLKEDLKGKHSNDLDELRSKSTRILYSYPVEWFDQVYLQWI